MLRVLGRPLDGGNGGEGEDEDVYASSEEEEGDEGQSDDEDGADEEAGEEEEQRKEGMEVDGEGSEGSEEEEEDGEEDGSGSESGDGESRQQRGSGAPAEEVQAGSSTDDEDMSGEGTVAWHSLLGNVGWVMCRLPAHRSHIGLPGSAHPACCDSDGHLIGDPVT
jgi:hypothetical protein